MPRSASKSRSAPAPDFLIVDIGHSNAKAMLVRQGKLVEDSLQSLPSPGLKADAFARWWSGLDWDVSEHLPVIYSCVVSALTEPVRKELAKKHRVERIRPEAQSLMKINYHPPESLGADRFLGALAARELFRPPLITIDFGTALTVNAVDKTGAFAGGLIAPGANLIRSYFAERAPHLPSIPSHAFGQAIATNTADAIQNGCWGSYAGGVSQLVNGVRLALLTAGRKTPPRGAEFKTVKLIATGGDVWLTRSIGSDNPNSLAYYRVHPLLVMEGLRIMGTHLLADSGDQ